MRLFLNLLLLGTFCVMSHAETGAGHEYDGIKLSDNKISTPESLPAQISIDSSKSFNIYRSYLFGYNFNWRGLEGLQVAKNTSALPVLNPNYLKAVKGVPFPLNRMSGTSSQYLQWKKAVGPMPTRLAQKTINWAGPKKQIAGPVEWINSIREVYPAAEFVWTVNMTLDTPKDAGDLAEFFMGNANTKWGAKRKAYGLDKPVVPVIWELGNELDWGSHKISVDDYISRCKKTIKAIRAIQPDAVFAALAATAPWARSQKKNWKNWHRKVLKELAPELNYLSFHPYYRGHKPEYTLQFINALIKDIKNCSNPNIKLYMSEHAKWPPGREKGEKNWRKNWYQTHALIGCLDTAEWMILMINNPEVGAMTYHSHCAGPWGLIYRDRKSGKYYLTGIADMFKLFAMVPYGSQVINCKVDGKYTDCNSKKYNFSSAAIKGKNGKIYVLLNNRLPNTSRKTTFNFKKGSYNLLREITLTATSLHSHNTAKQTDIKLIDKKIIFKPKLKEYTVPGKTLVLLILEQTL